MKMKAVHTKTGQVLYFHKQSTEQALPVFRKYLENEFSIDAINSLTMAVKFKINPVVNNFGRGW